jgi:hypothetical protein
MTVKVKWSILVKIITVVALAILFIAEYSLMRSLFYSINWLLLIAAILVPGSVFYFILNAPRYLELTESHLILHKVMGKLSLTFDQISNIEGYKPDGSEIRLFGSGGIFGFTGKFKNATIGSYQSYVGNYKQAFLIQTKSGKKYMFSCENKDFIIDIVKKQIL